MKKILICLLACLLTALAVGCGPSGTRVPDPDEIVPARDVLIDNLLESGYVIAEVVEVEGFDAKVDRIMAQKGKKFIDIVYGLSEEDAAEVFECFCELYPDGYYILAQNGTYVYCVSDRRTFKKAGFASTANVGVQYICN